MSGNEKGGKRSENEMIGREEKGLGMGRMGREEKGVGMGRMEREEKGLGKR